MTRVAEAAPGPKTGELYAADDDGVVLVLEDRTLEGVERRIAACAAIPGVQWVDRVFFSAESGGDDGSESS